VTFLTSLEFVAETPKSIGQRASPGFLRPRSGQALRLRAISRALWNSSARRFAQDDGFVRRLEKQKNIWLGVQKTRKTEKVTGSQNDVFAASWRCKKPASSRIFHFLCHPTGLDLERVVLTQTLKAEGRFSLEGKLSRDDNSGAERNQLAKKKERTCAPFFSYAMASGCVLAEQSVGVDDVLLGCALVKVLIAFGRIFE
jgi:hypothetical protein